MLTVLNCLERKQMERSKAKYCNCFGNLDLFAYFYSVVSKFSLIKLLIFNGRKSSILF